MTLFDSPAYKGHESVHAFQDEKTGLKAIIAIHSTARGPAVGGCRMWPYDSAQAALEDVLKLSRGMSYKNAVADLEMGGGKSVIIGDSRTQKTPELFQAFGRAVDTLGGRYWSAEDVGISVADIMQARKTTQYVVGVEGHPAASGDPSPVTAEGVYRGILVAIRHGLGGRDVNGCTVAIQGVGHVGGILAGKLHAAGARLIVTDVNQDTLREVSERTGARIVKPDEIFDADADVFAPCALGGAISEQTLARLKPRVIAGGANNQLASEAVGGMLFERGVTYAPDYVINGGGIINVASELHGLQHGHPHNPQWVEGKLSRLMETLDEVLTRSRDERRPSNEVADEIAEARIAAARA